jgi:3',5'-cyclic-AMP phosphodiesterase
LRTGIVAQPHTASVKLNVGGGIPVRGAGHTRWEEALPKPQPTLCENRPISALIPSSAREWACDTYFEPAGLVTRLTAKQPQLSRSATVHWALLADPHISADPSRAYRGLRPAEHAREAVAEIPNAGLQAALIAGDLAWDEGLPGDYTHLRAILEPLAAQMPVSLMLGNHDSRPAFLAEFCPRAPTEPAVENALSIIEHGPVRWILLDSLFRTDIVAGLLGRAQRCWLRRRLEASDQRPTLVVVHHPLDDDDDSLLDGDRLFRLVEPFQQVKAILTAHDHAYRVDSRGGIHIVSLPALGIPFDEREPLGWIEASLSDTAGAFTFHAVGENRSGDRSVTTLAWR